MVLVGRTKFVSALLLILCGCVSLHAFDLPVFYRVPLMSDEPKKNINNWLFKTEVRVMAGQADRSRNCRAKKVQLLDNYGLCNIARLGKDLQEYEGTITTWQNTPPTEADPVGYWNIDNESGKFDQPGWECGEGRISVLGKVHVYDIGITLQQNFVHGFYMQFYAPVRHVKLDQTCYRVCEETKSADLRSFIGTTLPDNDFAKILSDYGFCKLTNHFHKTSMPDFVLSLGWQGFNDKIFGQIQSLKGYMQLGGLASLEKRSEKRLWAFPLGSDGHLGIVARLGAEAGFWDVLAVGLTAGATMFFREERTIRMQNQKEQSGWIFLDQGNAKIDKGSIWSFHGYLKADHIARGFSCLVGASFTREEATDINVHESCFLQRIVEQVNQNGNSWISKNDIVSHDERFKAWECYALHVKASYDFGYERDAKIAPSISIEYDYPITGKRIFVTDMVGGSLGLNVQFQF